MAGKYVTFINPGYSLSWVKELPYLAGTNESASINPLNGNDARALVEGEWLQRADASGRPRWTRGGSNTVTTPGTKEPGSEATVPSSIYYMEQGRYDAQAVKLVNCVVAPFGAELRTKLCQTSGLAVNDPVSVWDWDGEGGAYGVVRRVLAAHNAGYIQGRVVRIYGLNDMAIQITQGA